MKPNKRQDENRFYINETCYILQNAQKLINGDESIDLDGKIWLILKCLMDRHDSLVTYPEIWEKVWPEERDLSFERIGYLKNRFHQHMNRLRKYFKEVGVGKTELENVLRSNWGDGYKLIRFYPTKETIDILKERLHQTGIGERELSEFSDCILHLGISGRMGRERLIVLANAGNRMAALELGELYYYGYITRNHRPDFKTACEWYKKAGDHPVALWSLGYCIMNNLYPVVDSTKIDYKLARDYFEQTLAITTENRISAAAWTSIGILWETGHFPTNDFSITGKCEKPNKARAIELYEKADKLEYHYATNRLGLYYEKKGRIPHQSSEEDKQKAFNYFSRSVSLVVDGYALNKLGLYYEEGFGCAFNPDKACEYYIRGVEEPLADDITGWNYFNAGRVYANRIRNQPQIYFDLSRAFNYFDEALRKLPVEEHGTILLEMLEIINLTNHSSHVLAQIIFQTRVWIERFLNFDINENTDRDKRKAARLSQQVKEIRYNVQLIDELLPKKMKLV